MNNYERPEILSEEGEDVCVDVHSSGIGLVVLGAIVITILLPPTEVH